MTHDELVALAARWLFARGCIVVVTELATRAREQPDAIGWRYSGECHVAECKVSRRDLLADRRKPGRRYPDLGVGDYRWLCTPAGLVGTADVPGGWGWVEFKPGARPRQLVAATARWYEPRAADNAHDAQRELLAAARRRVGAMQQQLTMLLSAMRRAEPGPGVAARLYKLDTERPPRATIGWLTDVEWPPEPGPGGRNA